MYLYFSGQSLSNRCFLGFLFNRNSHPRTMEQRDYAFNIDCPVFGGTVSQRHLDDSKCYNDRKYYHSNGSKSVYEHVIQILCCLTIGIIFIFKRNKE